MVTITIVIMYFLSAENSAHINSVPTNHTLKEIILLFSFYHHFLEMCQISYKWYTLYLFFFFPKLFLLLILCQGHTDPKEEDRTHTQTWQLSKPTLSNHLLHNSQLLPSAKAIPWLQVSSVSRSYLTRWRSRCGCQEPCLEYHETRGRLRGAGTLDFSSWTLLPEKRNRVCGGGD